MIPTPNRPQPYSNGVAREPTPCPSSPRIAQPPPAKSQAIPRSLLVIPLCNSVESIHQLDLRRLA